MSTDALWPGCRTLLFSSFPGARRDATDTPDAVSVCDGFLTITTYTENGRHFTGVISTEGLFESLDLSSHLPPQRSNGVRSMVERIKNDARAAV